MCILLTSELEYSAARTHLNGALDFFLPVWKKIYIFAVCIIQLKLLLARLLFFECLKIPSSLKCISYRGIKQRSDIILTFNVASLTHDINAYAV